ncbi:MAG: helix-turn-helix transcriptional regulator [Bacteroidetes bacterium]|nr:helix-turn-helix transcriptional regulator [Bacteroidota bacterium]
MTFCEKEIIRIREIRFSNQRQINIVKETREIIDENIDGDLNLDFLSDEKRISKYHLPRLFKRYYGLSQ